MALKSKKMNKKSLTGTKNQGPKNVEMKKAKVLKKKPTKSAAQKSINEIPLSENKPWITGSKKNKAKLLTKAKQNELKNSNKDEDEEGIKEPPKEGSLGNDPKDVEKFFENFNTLLAEASLKELNRLFDETAIRNFRVYSHRSDPKFRQVNVLIERVLKTTQERISKKISTTKNASTILLGLIDRLDTVEGGNFDTKIGLTSLKFSEFLIKQLDANSFERFFEKALNQEIWSLRRVEAIFKTLGEKQKVQILSKIARHKKSAENFNLICNLIDHLFVVKFRRGKFFEVVLDVADANVFEKVVGELRKAKLNESIREKNTDEKYQSLYTLSAILKILSMASPLPTDSILYGEDAKEVERCARKFIGKIFLDLGMSILIRHNRVHKAIIYYTFGKLCAANCITGSDMEHVIESIGKTDNELDGDVEENDDDDEEDFKPISKEDLEKYSNKMEIDDENEEEDNETDSEDDESDNQEEVDPALVANLKKALGKNAIPEDDSEFSDNNMEMKDQEVVDLDDALGKAFGNLSKKNKEMKKEEFRVFRSKCLELITIFISLADFKEILPLFVPLIDVLQRMAKQGTTNEYKSKIMGIFKTLMEYKKKKMDADLIIEEFEKISNLAENITESEIKDLVSQTLCYLFSVSVDHSKQEIAKKLLKFLEKSLVNYVGKVEKSAIGDVFNDIFFKYSPFVVDLLPKILDQAFDETYPSVKRLQLLDYAVYFMRKDLIVKDSNRAIFAKVAKKICNNLKFVFKSDLFEDGNKTQIIKFAAKFFLLLFKFCQLASKTDKDLIKMNLTAIDVKIDSDELIERLKPIRGQIKIDSKNQLKLDNAVRKFVTSMNS